MSEAMQIGISDVAIAKHCRKLGVPIPERGYWNKLQAGKPVTKKRTRQNFCRLAPIGPF